MPSLHAAMSVWRDPVFVKQQKSGRRPDCVLWLRRLPCGLQEGSDYTVAASERAGGSECVVEAMGQGREDKG